MFVARYSTCSTSLSWQALFSLLWCAGKLALKQRIPTDCTNSLKRHGQLSFACCCVYGHFLCLAKEAVPTCLKFTSIALVPKLSTLTCLHDYWPVGITRCDKVLPTLGLGTSEGEPPTYTGPLLICTPQEKEHK